MNINKAIVLNVPIQARGTLLFLSNITEVHFRYTRNLKKQLILGHCSSFNGGFRYAHY